MSQYYSLLFVWSKGASTRRKIFKILAEENSKGRPIYISKLTELYNNLSDKDSRKLTNSSIRKNIKVLKEYNLVKAINEGGRPEYLELTDQGKKILEKLESKTQKITTIKKTHFQNMNSQAL